MTPIVCKHCQRPLTVEHIDRTASTIALIRYEVCEMLAVSEAEVAGRSRWKSVARARHIVIHVARVLLPARSSVQLGRDFALHHTSVLYALSMAATMLAGDDSLRLAVEDTIARLRVGGAGQPAAWRTLAKTVVRVQSMQRGGVRAGEVGA